MKYIIEVLPKWAVSMRCLNTNNLPSWGYMISKGATTIWEDGIVTGASLSEWPAVIHIWFSSAWFYKYLAGINVNEEGPGFSKFTIKYMPDGLDFAEGSVKTMLGVVYQMEKEMTRQYGGRCSV